MKLKKCWIRDSEKEGLNTLSNGKIMMKLPGNP